MLGSSEESRSARSDRADSGRRRAVGGSSAGTRSDQHLRCHQPGLGGTHADPTGPQAYGTGREPVNDEANGFPHAMNSPTRVVVRNPVRATSCSHSPPRDCAASWVDRGFLENRVEDSRCMLPDGYARDYCFRTSSWISASRRLIGYSRGREVMECCARVPFRHSDGGAG